MVLLSASPPRNSRAMNGIERALRRGVNMSRIKYDKDGIERRKLEIEGILNTLSATLAPPPPPLLIPLSSASTSTLQPVDG